MVKCNKVEVSTCPSAKIIMNNLKTSSSTQQSWSKTSDNGLRLEDGLDPGVVGRGYGQTFTRYRRESSAASIWGGETACSYDSGYSSGGFDGFAMEKPFGSDVMKEDLRFWKSRKDSTPDLLDCLIMEDLEERILQIRAGVTKPSEIVCLKNLINLIDLQPSTSASTGFEQDGLHPSSKMRAIIGTGSRDGVSAGASVVAPPSSDYYHQDIQRLQSLLEQEVPLTFPGQGIPLNIKLGTDLNSFRHNGNGASIHNSLHPQSSKKQQMEVSKMIHVPDARKLKSEYDNDVHLRIGEGFFQLQSLVGERMKLEETFRFQDIKLPMKKDVFFGSWGTKYKGRELQEFLEHLSKEQERIFILIQKVEHAKQKPLEKSLFETFCDWKNLCLQLVKIMRTSRGRFQWQCQELVDGLRGLNKGTRRMRTLLWTLQP